ncbi:hypothetical protein BpHYR1_011820 [Brachionus plicatilis]|uniref:Uncharacterized protein n=1 Tax=Brachionus plicatilis TaxID=10195 RepID=A0A3M7RVY0_BRAPC|nr:hypothetical protein BpHYR1_011820 [Brachionus plicatilis]
MGGVLGLKSSILSVVPVKFPFANKLLKASLLKFVSERSGPTVNHPCLRVLSLPNKYNLLLPKQKCSIILKISSGLSAQPSSGSSEIIKSISILNLMH